MISPITFTYPATMNSTKNTIVAAFLDFAVSHITSNCLLSLLIACMLDVRTGKLLSVVSNHSVCLCYNVAMCLSSPMSHIPQLVLSQLRYHDCRIGGRCCDDSELVAALNMRSLENPFCV